MCTSLVVREEYWDKQIEIYVKIMGIDINRQQVEYMKVHIIDFAEYISECVRQASNVYIDAIQKMVVIIKDSISAVTEAFQKLFKECKITSQDDFVTIYDKLENWVVYLNRQKYIKMERYYKLCFSLIKINYNIMNHDKRC